MSNFSEQVTEFTSWWIWILGLIFLTVILGGIFKFVTTPAQLVGKVTDANHIIYTYEEFQNSHNAILSVCQKIDNTKKLTKESAGFSNEERVLALENKLSTLVADYNAKSKMITRQMWKSKDLPHTINELNICQN